MEHLDAGRSRLDDEGADLLRAGVSRHHDQQLGDRAVGAPELLAVEDVGIPLRRQLGRGGQLGRVGADAVFRQREGGDRPRGASRQESLLLIVGSENLDRLGHADGLVRREQGRDVAVVAAEQLHDPAVLDLIEPEAAVLLRNLHPEGAQSLQPVHDLARVLAGSVDLAGTDVIAQERLEALVELGELRPLLQRVRNRTDQVHLEIPEEDLLQEARLGPLGLPCGFRDAQGLPLALTVNRLRRAHVGPRPRVNRCVPTPRHRNVVARPWGPP
jgi:hypothetical protein